MNNPLKKQGEHITTQNKNKLIYHEKILHYLFLCFAYELKNDREKIIYQESEWSDPETTFSIVMNNSGDRSFDYCCSCIEILGGQYRRECAPVTTIYTASKIERDKLKQRFIELLTDAETRLVMLNENTPQEFYALKTTPIIKEIFSTECKHIVVLNAAIFDAVDCNAWDETLDPWADYERIRDYHEFEPVDDGTDEIRVVFYRIRKQRKFVKYLRGLGL